MLFMILNGVFAYTRYLKKQNIGYKKENYQTWGKGAGAELLVEHELDKLPAEYKVINDFNTGHGNIDHIIIGPKGIFTIETKSSKGAIQYSDRILTINGKTAPHDYIAQTIAEVNYLSQIIGHRFQKTIPITGILEFPYGQIDTKSIHGKIESIWVGGNNFHSYVLKISSYQLNGTETENIYTCLTEFSKITTNNTNKF